MRKEIKKPIGFILICSLCIIGAYFIRCDETPGPTGVTGFTLSSIDDTILQNECMHLYWFTYTQNDVGTHYYRILVSEPGDTNIIGASTIKESDGSYQSHFISVDYTLGLVSGKRYDFTLTVSEQPSSNPIQNAGPYTTPVVIPTTFTRNNCQPICCIDTEFRYRAFASKYVNDVVGAAGTITTLYGQLCPDISMDAQMGAWVGIVDDFAIYEYAAQIGYMIKRINNYDIDTFVYCEIFSVDDTTSRLFLELNHHLPDSTDYIPLPEYGSPHSYYCEVHPEEAVMVFGYDDVFYMALSAPKWLNKSVNIATWQGEIDGFETDMPGTAGNECVFSNCQYLLESNENYYWAEFTSDDTIGVSDDTEAMRGEWSIDYDHLGSVIEIWDNYPLD